MCPVLKDVANSRQSVSRREKDAGAKTNPPTSVGRGALAVRANGRAQSDFWSTVSNIAKAGTGLFSCVWKNGGMSRLEAVPIAGGEARRLTSVAACPVIPSLP
jgi:hypothetical protein